MMYDYLIIGSGLFGSTFAHQMNKFEKKCLVLEKRSHIGGNCWSEVIDGIDCHKYGPHTFHTNKKEVWDFINNVSEFRNFILRTKVRYKNKLYSFPINLLTLHQIFGVTYPEEAMEKIEILKTLNPDNNAESWITSQIGKKLYKLFYEGYSTKQWGRPPREIPSSVAKRIPIRYNFEDNYFTDMYQGQPVGGYKTLFKNLLAGIEVKCDIDYFLHKPYWDSIAKKIIFTGKIDEYYEYKFGDLEYRGLEFMASNISVKDFQGCPIINFADLKIPFTRSVEYKHFDPNFSNLKHTIVVYERSIKAGRKDIPYYPINDIENNVRYQKYKEIKNSIIFGGRIGNYVYNDMGTTVENALKLSEKERILCLET